MVDAVMTMDDVLARMATGKPIKRMQAEGETPEIAAEVADGVATQPEPPATAATDSSHKRLRLVTSLW
jgi:hypothetical protein